MRRRIAAALLAALLLTGCAPAAEPAAEPAEPAGEPVYMALTFDDGPSPAWTPPAAGGPFPAGGQGHVLSGGQSDRRPGGPGAAYPAGGPPDRQSLLRPRGPDGPVRRPGPGGPGQMQPGPGTGAGAGKLLAAAPYGFISQEELRALGTPAICWSVDTEDWKSRDVDSILDIVLRRAGDGDILLLHDCYATSVTAALEIVDRLQPRGCGSSQWRSCSPSRGCSLPAGPCTAGCGANKTRILSKMTMDAGPWGAYNRARFQKEQTP